MRNGLRRAIRRGRFVRAILAGEWGQYRNAPSPSKEFPQYRGERVAISDCSGQTCTLQISINSDAGHCDSSGKSLLQVESASSAIASISDFSYNCSIELQKSGSDAASVITAVKSNGCQDFCTPGANFNHSFPLHARMHYVGDHIEECYLGTSRTQMAICSDQKLAEKESKWNIFSDEVYDLEGKRFDSVSAVTSLKQQCDNGSDPAACLSDELARSTANLEQRKQAWLAEVTQPGDAKEAAAKIALLAGRYRHTFESGDVQGDSFKATDKLQISKQSNTSIHYSLLLNFYNGHECSRDGMASYKQNGAFVDIDKPESGSTCYFEILPTRTGIQLVDPTGNCKEDSCGARGGYNGAGFTFKEKIKTAP